MNIELIKFFQVSVSSRPTVDPIKLNMDALKVGYVVHPYACNEDTQRFINSLNINYNSTFYNTWEQVEAKSEERLFIDQVLYYMFDGCKEAQEFVNWADGYENRLDGINVDYSAYKTIMPCTYDELYDRCYDVVCNGLAMKQNTLKPICAYIMEYQNINGIDIDIESIKNKEAQCILSYGLGKFPKDNFALLRLLVYHRTGKTTIIKSKEMLDDIKLGENQIIPDFDIWGCLTDEQLISLSKIFYRFKSIFLAFRYVSTENKQIVNKIRRYAKKYHTPFTTGYWESILSERHDVMGINIRIGELSNFKLVKLIEAAYEKINAANKDDVYSLYKIRNGKMFVTNTTKPSVDEDYVYYLHLVAHLFVNRLIANLSKKACVVKYPKGLHLVCPKSEKDFVGEMPIGSSFDMKHTSYIGIYWDENSGTNDFDLSAISSNGNKVGWNSYKVMDGLVYSGDVILPEPDATEILKCNNTCEDSIIFVNRYNGYPNSRFKLFYGMDKEGSDVDNVRMFDEKDVLFRTDMISDKQQKMIGVILDNNMYITDYDILDRTVSGGNPNLVKQMLEGLRAKMNCSLNLKAILNSAGFKEFDGNTDDAPELDLTDLKKDTLIKLFS